MPKTEQGPKAMPVCAAEVKIKLGNKEEYPSKGASNIPLTMSPKSPHYVEKQHKKF